MSFNNFKEAFEEKFGNNIYDFIDKTEWGDREVPLNGQKIDDLDEEAYDSYGYEDSTLRRIFYFEDYNVYVEFYGTRQSYSGEEWDGYREVTKSTKTISVWE